MSKTNSNKTLTSSSGLLIAALAGTATWLAFRRPAKAAKKTPPPPPLSPFIPGSNCTTLADGPTTLRWLTEVVEPLVLPHLDAFAIPLNEHEAARMAIKQLVDAVFQQTLPECARVDTYVSRQLWKGLWCEVVSQLVMRGKLDEELDDVLKLCLDPTFDPRVPKDTSKPPLIHPLPPFPRPIDPSKPPPIHPMPPFPRPIDPSKPPSRIPVEPMEGHGGTPLPNLWAATTRKELAGIGLMRMMEGTIGGAPIKGPSAHTVLFAYNPAWSGLEQAFADLRRLAAENPQLTFVEVSFVDSQRHFGKPKDLNELIWALTAAGPDGRVLPSAIVRDDPRDDPPSPDLWNIAVAHASGFVGASRVRRLVRPRRFGDFVIAMMVKRRPPIAAHSSSPKRQRLTRQRRQVPG